jgi:hypothetical protein
MKFDDLFCTTVLPIEYTKNLEITINHVAGDINYLFNNYGYRTHFIPDKVVDPHWLIVGCSHTEGVGVESNLVYSNLIEKKIQTRVFNLGQSGGNNITTELNIVKWIENIGKPDQIIAQWPSAYRKFIWDDNSEFPDFATRVTAKDNHALYNLIAKHSVRNFHDDQIKSIIVTNKLCQALGIKIFNFMNFE